MLFFKNTSVDLVPLVILNSSVVRDALLTSGCTVSLSSGVGRTGAFCLLYAALQELEAGNGIPDLPLLVKKMRQQRKNMLQEKVRHTER